MPALVLAVPAEAARSSSPKDAARTYVEARAASLSGDHGRSARLLAALAQSQPGDLGITRRALSEAIGAGDMRLALRLVRRLPPDRLGVDARLLLAAEDLRRRRPGDALQRLAVEDGEGNLAFLTPVLAAWEAADRGDSAAAVGVFERMPEGSLSRGYGPEHQALILIKFRRTAEADAIARRAVETAGPRANRLRLAFADAFLAAGDRQRAMGILEGMGPEGWAAQRLISAGRPTGVGINSSADAFSELLLGLAVDLSRMNSEALPIGFAQIARYAAPNSAAAAVLLGILLDRRGRTEDALAVLRTVPMTSALSAHARDAESRVLVQAKRLDQALAHARTSAARSDASSGDWARLGDVLHEAKRYDEAADAYDRAIQLSRRPQAREIWPLYLLRASALERGKRWPEARSVLESALRIAPEEPLILNFLGYAKLERGEDIDAAEAMIVKAVALAPDDASIIDSLGWAQFKQGRVDEAIETLQTAAVKDPEQAEIHEHLGDALYTAGRKYEARFAWRAALFTAEDDVAGRIRAKIEWGLTPATAAP
ncbi:MAG TPA: tetratricopeptide repeat protein [Sphingomicrobium sp.]|nr:tetratricopeptide repeat protein [Sphingomicrobium sp.]